MRTLSSLIAVLGLVACGGDGGGGESVPIDEYSGEIGRALCGKLFECCSAEELEEQVGGAANEMECAELYAGFGSLFTKLYKDSIAAGRLSYDGNKMARCIDKLEGLSCPALAARAHDSYETLGCENPFDGNVAPGGTCATSFDCVSEWCNGDSIDLDGNITYGTCGDPPTAGMPCDGFECGAELYCELDTCEPIKADGMACTGSDECISRACNDGTCGVATTCDGM